ncbi:class II aldolase/adducin family protein [Sphingomonas sp. UYP23]
MTSTADARLEIAQASRILAGEKILDAYGHVSRRHPDRADAFLISRNLAPALVTPMDIVELDLDGVEIGDTAARLFLERFIHAEIYRHRPDVQAVVHSHAMEVLPFATVPSVPVRVISHMCGFLRDTPAPFDLADHFGPETDLLIRDAEMGKALAAHLGTGPVVLMRGHGYTTAGASVPDAVYRAIYTAHNCQIQRQAMQMGDPVYLSPGEALTADTTIMHESDRAWACWLHDHVPTGEFDAVAAT